jgi:hypothetical protein
LFHVFDKFFQRIVLKQNMYNFFQRIVLKQNMFDVCF